jgi:cellulose synthase/poly-beta-1,6-N-acetylglucosamine synthase-like glycosyltransferase
LDNCTDATKDIIETHYSIPEIKLIEFKERLGKPNVLNKIIADEIAVDASILVLTDANVMFEPDTIFELIKIF